MKILCVIPSRIASTRLPRKPLLPIQGKPMIQWTFENAARCSAISKLIVATDSDEIAQVVHSIGGEVHMTDPHLQTGSDRVAAVAEQYSDMDIVTIVQDEKLKKDVAAYVKEATRLSEYEVDAHSVSKTDFIAMLANDEENFGKEVFRKHIIFYGAEAYYQMVKEAAKNGLQAKV